MLDSKASYILPQMRGGVLDKLNNRVDCLVLIVIKKGRLTNAISSYHTHLSGAGVQGPEQVQLDDISQ